MYEMGWGTRADKNKAIELYTKAAQKGNQLARDNLRRLGVAVPETADAAGALTNTTTTPPPAAEPQAAPASTATQKSDGGLPTVAAPATTAVPTTQQP
jgi:TPR repeat protein